MYLVAAAHWRLLFTLYFNRMNKKQAAGDPVKTVLVITVGFAVLYWSFKIQWLLYTSLVVGAAGILSPFLAKQVDFLWMKLASLLSLIVPNILLSAIFFLFLTPVAFLSKWFGNKNLLTLKNTEKSMFKDQKKNFDKAFFEKPW